MSGEFETFEERLLDVQRHRVERERNRLLMLVLVCLLPVITGYACLALCQWYLLPNGYIRPDHSVTQEEAIRIMQGEDVEFPILTYVEIEFLFHYTIILSFVITGMVVEREFKSYETAYALVDGKARKFRVLHYYPTSAGNILFGSHIYERALELPAKLHRYGSVSYHVLDEAVILQNAEFLERKEFAFDRVLHTATSPIQEGRIEVKSEGNKVEK